MKRSDFIGYFRRPFELSRVVVLHSHYYYLLFSRKHLDMLLVTFSFVGLFQLEMGRFEVTKYREKYLSLKVIDHFD